MTLADELRDAFLTAGLSEEQRAELIADGEEVPFEVGDVLFVEGESADFLWMLLEGRVELSRRIGTEVRVMMTMETPGQWAGGLRAWSDGAEHAGYRATGKVVAAGRAFRVPSDDLGRLVREWFPFGVHMTVGIYQTIRSIEANVRQREKLVALGTMSAGLAHEINNPTSAAARSVAALRTAGDGMIASITEMAQASSVAEQFAAIDALRVEASEAERPRGGALATADVEDEIGRWLTGKGVADAWQLAAVLAGAGVDRSWCERVEQAIGDGSLEGALRWTVSVLSAEQLLDELTDTTTRISELVAAMKSFSQVDRASLQEVDLHEGLESTLVMLKHKLRDVELERDFDRALPTVEANAGELNQVWTNLIDNAVDAMDGKGTLRITTRRDGSDLVVDIADSGPGIPNEIMDRIFEPFFTTKDVGKGTGLGLDLSRRIIAERHGDIAFDSSPEGATAHVRIPLERKV